MGFPGQRVKNKLEFQWKNSRLMGIFEVVAGCGWWLRGWRCGDSRFPGMCSL